MTKSHGYAAQKKAAPLAPFQFDRRELHDHDVHVDIQWCGVCHSDIHSVRDEWGNAVYPMVPGHEIVGTVRAIGSAVKKFKAGDLVGVGVIVDSDRTCPSCKAGEEQYCEGGATLTYGQKDKYGDLTYGGYSNNIVTDEHFVHRVSPKLNPAGVAPLLCAGITTYSPLRHWKVGPNKKVGIVGLGGLGHMGLKFAHAFGAHVVQFTTSESKIADAKRLGAHDVVISKDAAAMKSLPRSPQARRHLRPGRPPRQTPRHQSRQSHLQTPQLVRVHHRRHGRNSGDARLLRGEGNYR
jgi:uncharacterized zinc-type alcohol dehydrogenase-like protein